MRIKRKIVFRTPWFQIAAVDPGAEASGTTDPYYCLLRADGVICLVLDSKGDIVLVEQYRPPLDRTTLEMPAGNLEGQETPSQAAEREILEETGFVCERLIEVGTCRLLLNRESAVEHFFICLGGRPSSNAKRHERGIVHLVERPSFGAMMIAGQFEQTIALGGIYVAEKKFGFDLLHDDLATIERRLLCGA